MEIIVAKSAGFCFGVDRAIDTVYKAVKSYKNNIYTLGPIIHNDQVVKELESKGVKAIDNINEINDKNAKVIIRSHGVSESVYNLLDSKNITYIDATCPNVKRIHSIVKKHYDMDYTIIILGNPNHPEVIGINGWCNNSAFIATSIDDIKKVKGKLDNIEKICVVTQTTFNKKKWYNIKAYLKQNFKNALIFETICSATDMRQKETEEISKKVDIMIVIGGKHSSNTQKLTQICKDNCKNTFHIETFQDLPSQLNVINKKIGITAGASTPAWIIKEVTDKLTAKEEIKQTNIEESFAEAFEKSLITLNTGDIVKGTVISISSNGDVFVDLGYKSDGIIHADELSVDSSANPQDIVKPGDEIDVFVVRVDDKEGNVILSKKKIDLIQNWDKIGDAYKNKDIVKGKITKILKNGVIASVKGIEVFVPASQASDRYVKDLNTLLNKEVSLKVIDINNRRKRVTGSVRVVAQQERKRAVNEFWETIEEGKHLKGTVKTLTNFGAFVELAKGVDGLIHISQLSWSRIKHPSEVVKEGDVVEVYVISFNRRKKSISLGFKKAEDNPWEKAKSQLKKGDQLKGKVVKLIATGAFVELMPGVDGFIHISQLSWSRIKHPSEVVKEGDIVEVNILDFNKEKNRISLGFKKAEDNPWVIAKNKFKQGDSVEGKVVNITSNGAFIELIPGVDGFVHISQLSWTRIEHPSEVLKEGETHTFCITDFDKKRKKISLRLRKPEDNPWQIVKTKFNVDDVVKAKVVRFAPFGVFVDLGSGIEGLIHNSQVSENKGVKPEDILAVGQEVKARITEIDIDRKKIGLSIRAINSKQENKPSEFVKENEYKTVPKEYKEDSNVTIGDVLGDLFKDGDLE